MNEENQDQTTEELQKILKAIKQNKCTYENPSDCPNCNETLHYCMKPSINCSYRTENT